MGPSILMGGVYGLCRAHKCNGGCTLCTERCAIWILWRFISIWSLHSLVSSQQSNELVRLKQISHWSVAENIDHTDPWPSETYWQCGSEGCHSEVPAQRPDLNLPSQTYSPLFSLGLLTFKLEAFLFLPLPSPCGLTSVALLWSSYSHFLRCSYSQTCIYSSPIHLACLNLSNCAMFM